MLTQPLKNCRILVTRPSPSGEQLCTDLSNLGATTTYMPTITIHPYSSTQLAQSSQCLTGANIILFLSAHAVEPLMPHWPETTSATIFAIGPSTKAALKKHNIHAKIPTDNYSSEDLLALPALNNVNNKAIVICCGKNPKPLLFDTLKQRGANGRALICYERNQPTNNFAHILSNLKNTPPHLVICTSLDALSHLITLTKAHCPEILNCTLLTGSNHLSKQAKQSAWQGTILTADNTTNKALINRLTSWYTL